MKKYMLFPGLAICLVCLCFIGWRNTGRVNPVLFDETAKDELYKEIVKADSIFFEAYNTCKMEVMDSMISADIEFYHDQSGLTTSKQEILTALRNNICGKVTRELKPGSIEVYGIPNAGAVEMGMHGFHNNQEKPPPYTRFAKFVQLWKKEYGKWKLSRVISLH